MKKKIFGGIAVLAIAAVVAWNVNFNFQKSDLSDISLANVEALAETENGISYPCPKTGGTCYISVGQHLAIYVGYQP